MAADTAAKRLSAMQLGLPWRGPAVVPSGTVTSAERAAGLGLYSGIPGGGAPTNKIPVIVYYYRQQGIA